MCHFYCDFLKKWCIISSFAENWWSKTMCSFAKALPLLQYDLKNRKLGDSNKVGGCLAQWQPDWRYRGKIRCFCHWFHFLFTERREERGERSCRHQFRMVLVGVKHFLDPKPLSSYSRLTFPQFARSNIKTEYTVLHSIQYGPSQIFQGLYHHLTLKKPFL